MLLKKRIRVRSNLISERKRLRKIIFEYQSVRSFWESNAENRRGKLNLPPLPDPETDWAAKLILEN